jgi:hypothetical protein
MSLTKLIDALAVGIARAEGYFVRGSLPNRNNNPGDLRDTSGKLYPKYPKDRQGYVQFPDTATGWQALKNDLRIKLTGKSKTGFIPGWTFDQFADLWASTSPENQRRAWARTVASAVGNAFNMPAYDVSTPIARVMSETNYA